MAEESGKQSVIIGEVLKKMKASIEKIIASAAQVMLNFEGIDSGIKIVAQQEENIRNAMEEQSEGSKHILEALHQLNCLTSQVKNESFEMMEGSREIIDESKNLERVSHEISGSMNEMASGAEQINDAINRVNDISVKNMENISLLVKEVEKFRVE